MDVAHSDILSAGSGLLPRWAPRIPIVIGAIGHRNIDVNDPKLIEPFKRECRRLKRRYENSPFVVLSALAEGADRLLTQIAMEELSADLIAVLPMPQEDYERDFATDASKAAFRALLANAVSVKIAKLPDGEGWKTDGEPRNEQYARAGAIIADHAQILFAIWDGQPARGTGGTAEQIEWFDRGYSPKKYSAYFGAISPLDASEPGRRICVNPKTHQLSITPPPDAKRTGETSDIRSILSRTERYNRDAQSHKANIVQSPALAAQGEGPKTLALTNAGFRAADCLSIRSANEVRRFDVVVYGLALIAVIAFNFVTSEVYAPWIYLGITVVMLLLATRVWAWSVENRFLEYRCLAEAMRTLYFWRGAGVMRPVWIGTLSRQRGVVHWIRQAVRTLEFCQDCQRPIQKAGINTVTPEDVAFVKENWVDGQKKWFVRKQAEHAWKKKLWTWIFGMAIAASFATAIVLALSTVIPNETGASLWKIWVKPNPDLWQAVLAFFAGGGLAARGFLERRAHAELAKQYASQGHIFETASRTLEEIQKQEYPEWTAEEILSRLGEEASQEQAEWLWLRHSRPFEVPAN
jgi:hypothetical protein